jgi:hypothetical protein
MGEYKDRREGGMKRIERMNEGKKRWSVSMGEMIGEGSGIEGKGRWEG